MPDSYWVSRLQLLGSRGVLALVGFARTILVIRWLSTSDYALLALAESVRLVVTVVAGLGISEAVAREGAIENDRGRLLSLVSVGLGHTTIFALASFALMVLLAASAPLVGAMDSQLSMALIWAATVVPAERFWGYLQSCAQAMHAFRTYTAAFFCHGVTIAVLTVLFTVEWGVVGYFAAQTLVSGIGALVLGLITFTRLGRPTLTALRRDWRDLSVRLFPMAWFAYVSKCSLVLWRRLPIIVGAWWISPATLGTVAATFDLTSKLHLVQDALSPVILPTLAKRFREHPDSYAAVARRELNRSLATNMVVFALAGVLWLVLGKQAVGVDRWTEIQPLFFGAMAVESALLVANIMSLCVLLPAGHVSSGLGVITFGVRVVVAPVLVVIAILGFMDGPAIIFAMVATGSALAVVYATRAARFLRTLRALS